MAALSLKVGDSVYGATMSTSSVVEKQGGVCELYIYRRPAVIKSGVWQTSWLQDVWLAGVIKHSSMSTGRPGLPPKELDKGHVSCHKVQRDHA